MDAVGLFRPYDQKKPASQPVPEPEPVAVAAPVAAAAPKNRPTPTRQQAQAARMDALHPKLTRRQATAQDRAAADKKRMADLQAADNKPERVLLRNYVDSRLSVTQFILPVMLIAFAASLASVTVAIVTFAFMVFLYVIVIVCILNFVLAWRGFRRELATRVPNASTKGLLMMMISRMIMIPSWRQPKPTIKRGQPY